MSFERLDHTAIVVADLDEAISRWTSLTGASISCREVVQEQGVEIAMLTVGDTQLELVCPVGAESGVARFLEKRGEALHHVGLLVDNIDATLQALSASGIELIDRTPRETSHGRIAFLHPRSAGGVLVELVEHSS